jgi:hypothetical protein
VSDRPGEAYVEKYSKALKKKFGAKGGEPVHELAPELVALYHPGLRLEDFFLLDDHLFASELNAAAQGAGNFGVMSIENPAASGLLGVVTFMANVAPIAGQSIFYGIGAAGLAAGETGVGLTSGITAADSRAGFAGKPLALLTRTSFIVVGGLPAGFVTQGRLDHVVNVIESRVLQFVIGPGARLAFSSGTVNTQFLIDVQGYVINFTNNTELT